MLPLSYHKNIFSMTTFILLAWPQNEFSNHTMLVQPLDMVR